MTPQSPGQISPCVDSRPSEALSSTALERVHLDHAASTPVDPRVLESMQRWWGENYANPSSSHAAGVAASEALDEARRRIARATGAQAKLIVFTSGATEANNLAVFGHARARKGRGRHVLVGPLEHPSTRMPALQLAEEGFEVEELSLDSSGALDLEEVRARVRPDTVLVTQMFANNEFGCVFPIRELTRIVRRTAPHAAVHVDAVQALGKIELDIGLLGVDSLSISGHKVNGPKGAGALIRANDAPIQALIHGGGQETGLRGGTQDVPSICGLGHAVKLAEDEREESTARTSDLMRTLRTGIIQRELGRVIDPGAPKQEMLPNIISVIIEGPPAEVFLHHLDARGLAASAGSACQSSKKSMNPALFAIGLKEEEARRVLRLSIGKVTSHDEIQRGIQLLDEVRSELANIT